MAHELILAPHLRPPHTVPRRQRDLTVPSQVCLDKARTAQHIPRRVHGFPPMDGILRSRRIIMMRYVLPTVFAQLRVHRPDRRHSRQEMDR